MERVALITGGSQGIGLAIANELAARGIERLVLVARTASDLALAKSTIESAHPKTHADTLSLDLTDSNAYETIRKHLESYGKLDILVNNAGTFAQLPLPERSSPQDVAHDVQKLFFTNTYAPAVFSLILRDLQLAAKNPKQLDILSSAGIEIFPGNTPYGPSKVSQERISLAAVMESNGKISTYRMYPSNVETRLVKQYSVPKLTPQYVAQHAVGMLFDDKETDIYLKQVKDSVMHASFKLTYKNYVSPRGFDGLGLAQDHREALNTHFVPVIRRSH